MGEIGFWQGLVRDLSSAPLRLVLQPAMAVLLGARFGLADARKGASPFYLRLLSSKNRRLRLIGHSLRHAVFPLALALILDGIFQYLTLGRVRILPAIVVGFLLVWLPFTISRGVTNRIWRRSHPVRKDVSHVH